VSCSGRASCDSFFAVAGTELLSYTVGSFGFGGSISSCSIPLCRSIMHYLYILRYPHSLLAFAVFSFKLVNFACLSTLYLHLHNGFMF